MQLKLKVFILSPLRGPGQAPERGPELMVDGPSLDEIRSNARTILLDRGYRVRALSFSSGALLAYVEGTA